MRPALSIATLSIFAAVGAIQFSTAATAQTQASVDPLASAYGAPRPPAYAPGPPIYAPPPGYAPQGSAPPGYAPPGYAPPGYATRPSGPVMLIPGAARPAPSNLNASATSTSASANGAPAPSPAPQTTPPVPGANPKAVGPVIPQVPVPPTAQGQWAQCSGPVGTDAVLAACTTVIVVAREPNDRIAQAYKYRARTWHEKAQYNAAIADFDQAVRLAPNDVEGLQGRCLSRAVVGQLNQALKDCTSALKLKPNDVATLETRGFVYRKMRAFDKSVADYDAALQLNPKQATALFGRGVAKLDSGDRGGQADISQAKSLQSDVALGFQRYGVYR